MRLVHKRQIQRTFWHSGMLLILCSLCALVPRAGSNTVPSQGSRVASIQVNSELVQNGFKIRRDDVASSVSCDMPGAEGSVTVWKFNGEPISDLNTVQSSKEEGRLECYASSGEFQSLAFVVVSEDGGNSGGEQSGEIVSGPVPVSRAAEGATFKFQCKISQPAGDSGKTQWLKNGRQPPLENGGKFKISQLSETESELTVGPLDPGDSANYGCLVPAGFYQEGTLFVEGPITLEVSPLEQRVDYGQPFSLECETGGSSSPGVTWELNGQPLAQGGHLELEDGGLKLTVGQATLDNVGEFKCLLEGGEGGSDSAKVDLIYELPEIDETRLGENGNIMILEGSDLSLGDCFASGKPEPEVFWVFNAEEVGQIRTSVTREEDQGEYTCRATNPFGTASKAVTVEIASKTAVISQPEDEAAAAAGEEAVIHAALGRGFVRECKFRIDPKLQAAAEMSWEKDGEPLDPSYFTTGESTTTVELTTVTQEASGLYTCSLKTSLDSASSSFQLEVIQIPIIKPFPKVKNVLRGPLGEADLERGVVCATDGMPQPEVKWISESDGTEFEGPHLSLKGIDSATTFLCEATNAHGTATRQIQINPVDPTALSMSNGTVITENAGSPLTLNCSVQVHPDLQQTTSFTWIKDSGIRMDQLVSKQDQSQLEIGYLRKENSGLYVCKVTTELDSVTVVQTVRVVSTPPTIVNKSKVKVGALSGGDTTLNCVAEGIPEPEISWKFRGQVIEKGSSSLEFAKVSANDSAGTYTCLAVNEYGMDQHEILLEVYKPIKFVKGPLDLLSNSLEKSVFDCQVEIDDRLKDETAITWTMNDGETVPEEFIEAPDKLVISSTLKDNQGTFTCSVSNSYESNVNMTARLTVLGEVPSFISTEKDVRALEGSHVTVSCQANGLPMPKIKWLKDGSPVPVQKETGRVQQLRLGDLKISDVSLDDQGSYTCLADNVYGTIQTNTSVEVIKRAVPDLKKRVRDITKAMRDNVTLGCDISYDPRVHHETDFVWNKEGEQLMNLSNKYQIQNDSSLLIFDLSMEDRGVYECQVKTPFETISHKVSLQVSGEAPKILSDLRKETIYEGGDLTLKCLVRGVPTPTLKWLFRDKPILPPTMVKSVTTASVEFVESHVIVRKASKANEGVYQCETSNIYGSGVAKFAKVVVIKKTTVEIASSEDEKAMSVHAGQKLKIPCHVGNDPLNRITNIQWTKNGKPITIGAQDRIDFGMDGSITISDVQRRHEGDYKCNVTTVHDHGADSISLSVVVNAPFITSHSNDQVIFSGDSLSLKCKASGIPEPRISWRFNQTRTSVHKKEFQITNAIVSDAGNYTCTARNDYGETKKMIPVAIIAVPTILPEYHVKTGVKLTLPCVSTDKNVQSSWIKDGASVTESQDVTILESGYLEIKSANSDTPGVYSCVVESKQNAKRRKILQTMVKLKPNIIIVEGGSVAIPEEEDLQLECKVLQGIDTKRLWKYNDQFVIEGGSKDIKERGKILTIDNVKQEDSGTYSCIAITNFGQDTIEYKVDVRPKPSFEDPSTRCDELSETRAQIGTIEADSGDNSSVVLYWDLPIINESCFQTLSLAWWTNDSKSIFHERSLSLSDRSAVISNLTLGTGYYIQINLVAPLNLYVYGETRSFTLDQILSQPKSPLESTDSNSVDAMLPLTMLLGVLGILVLLILSIVILYLKRHSLAMYCNHGPNSGTDNPLRRKRHIDGTAIDMYDGRIHISAPLRHNVPEEQGSSQALTPQWPEPEPVVAAEESEAFIPKPTRNGNGPPAGGRRNSRQSISSSWSSLFNVPTGADAGSVRSSTVSSGNTSGGHASGGAHRVSFAGIGSGRGYRRPSPNEQV